MNGKMEKIVESTPIMEMILDYYKENILCSIDQGIPAPHGANQFFNHYGYMIVYNICSPDDLEKINFGSDEIVSEIQTKIRLVLEYILEKKLTNKNFTRKIYSVNQKSFTKLNDNKNIISFVLQVDANSFIPYPFFIKDSNGNKCFVNLKNGHGVLYKGYEVECWRNNLETGYNKLGQILNKILRRPDDTYYSEIVFHFEQKES